MAEPCSLPENNLTPNVSSVTIDVSGIVHNEEEVIITKTQIQSVSSLNVGDIATNIEVNHTTEECTSPSPTETICGVDLCEPIAGPSCKSFEESLIEKVTNNVIDPIIDVVEEDIIENVVEEEDVHVNELLDNTINETQERILLDNKTPERLITRNVYDSNILVNSDLGETNRKGVLKNNLFNINSERTQHDGLDNYNNDDDNNVCVDDNWKHCCDDGDFETEQINDLESSELCVDNNDEDEDNDEDGEEQFEDEAEEDETMVGCDLDDGIDQIIVNEVDENERLPTLSDPISSSTGWRKRKLESVEAFPCKKIFPENKTASGGDTMETGTQDGITTTTTTTTTPSAATSTTLSTTSTEKKYTRCVIPTRDNPPPEMDGWLTIFQRWSNAERLLAIDELIDYCEPTQVRHMMQVIEPQFQRDFISLLPRELALNVLSFLEPRDLLRAAQTCRSWRFLAEDNLLWREKCRQAGIHEVYQPEVALTSKKARSSCHQSLTPNQSTLTSLLPPQSSPWKAAFMRQHVIEMNWRIKPIRPPKVLKGHDDHVITCLQFCGNRIVSGSDDNTLKVWSAVTGKCLRTLVGHTGGVWSSQMAGSIIISGSTDRTLKVWNAETGVCIHTLYGHTSTVRCMHLYENRVVSGSRDATLRMWDVVSGECLHVLVGHLAAVRCVQYDGRLVVSGAYDYMVKVWNPEREECLHTLQGHTNRVYSLQFDGVHVVSGSLDTSIRVWEVETGACRHTLMGHQSLTSGMELRNNILVSGNADSTVKVWDIVTGQCLQTLSGANKHQSAVTCLQFNNRFVITSSDDGTVKLWDVRTGEFIRNLVALDSGGSGGVVWRIRANDTKLVCAVGSRNGTEETKLLVLDFDVNVDDDSESATNLANNVITITDDR